MKCVNYLFSVVYSQFLVHSKALIVSDNPRLDAKEVDNQVCVILIICCKLVFGLQASPKNVLLLSVEIVFGVET